MRNLVFGLIDYNARVRFEGLENLCDTPVLYICNHLSNIDALILSRALKRNPPVFLAGVKLKDTRLTRLVLDLVDAVMIEPNKADIDALKAAISTLKSGRSMLIFPEGGRSRNGTLIRAKAGASLIARKAAAPIQPCALMGTENLLPIDDTNMGGEKLHKADVVVRIGKPFSMDEVTVFTESGKEDRQATTDAMMGRIASMLGEGYRGVYGNDVP